MTTAVQPPGPRPKPSTLGAMSVLVKLFVGESATRGRLMAVGSLSAIAALTALITRASTNPEEAAAELIAVLIVGLVVPMATLLVASSTLSDLLVDKTLVYLTLKPVSRVAIVASAIVSTLIVTLPLGLATVVLAVLLAGQVSLIWPSAVAVVMITIGYTGIFVPLGVTFKRAFMHGLVYVLLWGGLIANLGSGFAAVSVESYGVSLIEHLGDVALQGGDRSLGASVIVPMVFLAAGMGLGTWQLRRREID